VPIDREGHNETVTAVGMPVRTKEHARIELPAALRLFSEQGFAPTTFVEIAERREP
jgi:Bacterial regulatory proteins, tetR family